MKIAVVGTGYVGLVTGTCLAETGNEVTCVDIDAEKVKALSEGMVPIYEPNLDVLLERNLSEKRIQFTTDLKMGIEGAEIIFLALPTPPGADGQADLKFVLSVADQLGELISEYVVIVDKSTVPVGTAERVRSQIAAKTSIEFSVVSNPEFLREGFAVSDFMKPDRIVIGTSDSRAQKVLENLYRPFVRQGNPILIMDEKSAELTKYAANAFLATKISFMNEIANFCEKVGANVDHVRLGMGSDDRIGKRFLFPGIGYGGSCFPKDVLALSQSGHLEGYQFEIIDAVMRVNEKQRLVLFDKLMVHFASNLKGRKIAMWGLAFKPDTDDIREAPSIYLLDLMLRHEMNVSVYDPEALNNVMAIYGDKLNYFTNPYEALKDAEALVICTEWSVFRSPDFSKMKELMATAVVFDGRNIFEPSEIEAQGFTYYCIGR